MKTLIALLLSVLGLNASTVQFYMTNSAGVADTNYFRLIPIENPVLANGGVITRGPALRCYPAATGFFQTNLTVGWWQMTNSFLGQGILLEVPNDSFTYNSTNLMVSGFNTYVMSGLVGVTSSNGSVTIYPPAGRGTVDLAASGSIPLLAGSNVVIYQSGGSNVINSTASGTGTGVTNNQVLPGISSATNFQANLSGSTNPPNQEILLSLPHIGSGQSSPSVGGGSAPTTAGNTIAPAGTIGIVNNLWVVPDVGGSHGMLTNMTNLNLRIFPDAVTNGTVPAFDVPMGVLFGNFHRKVVTNQNYVVRRNSQYLDTVDISTNAEFGGAITTLLLKFPVPFTNGCFAQVWNTYSNNAWPFGYIYSQWQSNAVGVAPAAFGNWKLRSALVSLNSNPAANILVTNLPAASGMIVGVQESILNLTNTTADFGTALELNALRFVTAGTTTNTWPGGDDLFLTTYTAVAGPYIGYDYGVTHMFHQPGYTQYAVELYRWFAKDHFIWNRGSGCDVYLSGGSVNNITVAIYYYSL